MGEKFERTLLLVDDAPDNITFLKNTFESKYNIKAATNGKTALAIIEKTPPDLILLDINMPEMDGYEVCQELQKKESTKKIPIIFVTANTEEEQITKGFDVGGVDYVTKPFNPKELEARVTTHLTLKATHEKLEALAVKLGKYLSPELYNSIFSGEKDVKIETARKPLTVFFSDIVNFTSTSDKMDHEELTSWLNNYLNKMADIAIEFGGTIDKFIGDAVMVFFGDPQSKGVREDAINCVNMAKKMLETANALDFNIRIGVNTGECMVGNFGSENRMDYSIIGREVNVASRLESSAEPNSIMMSDSTFYIVGDKIPCSPGKEIRVKGIDRSIVTYVVNNDEKADKA